jgi:heme A synthase
MLWSMKKWAMLGAAFIVLAAWTIFLVALFSVTPAPAACEDWPCGNECENQEYCLDDCVCTESEDTDAWGICQ